MSSDTDGPDIDRVREALRRGEDDGPDEPATGAPDLDRVTEQRERVEDED